MKFSVAELEILFHCHYNPAPIKDRHTDLVGKLLNTLFTYHLITSTDEGKTYQTTDRGKAHIKQLCHLELPMEAKVWVGADGKTIKL